MTSNGQADIDRAIVESIERALENAGARVLGPHLRFSCPVHDDKHPSADWHRTKHVWKCRSCGAGGGAIDLARRLDIELPRRPPEASAVRPVVIATYDYVDELGQLLYQAVRYRPKAFRQRQPDGKDGWIWNVAGVRRVPYNLPALMESMAEPWDMPRVFVCEGERDADRLTSLGCVATTNVGGAGKWTEELSVYLMDRRVVILSDNDDAGRNHANKVAVALNGIAAEVLIVELPGLAEKGDISDWLDAGGTPADLERLISAAESANRDGKLRLLTPAELLVLPKPRWIVEDILVEDSLACIVGPPGTFKSFVALSLHFSIAAGDDWYGRFTVGGPSVYIIAEGVRGMSARVRAWERGYAKRSAPETARFVAEPLQLANGAADDVLDAIHRWGQVPRLIIVDTLARTAVGLEENSAKDMGQYIAAAEQLRRETGACILFIHHGTRAAGTPRGSSALDGAFDTLLTVKRELDSISIDCSKQKDAGEFHRFRLAPQVVQLGEGESSVVLIPSTLGEDINRSSRAAYAILREVFGDAGATSSEWLAAVKSDGLISEATFFRARKALIETGMVVSDIVGRGARYRLAIHQQQLSPGHESESNG